MKKTKGTTLLATTSAQRTALASPLRLELLGLFTNPGSLAIAEMAELMSRSAGSLYHHVGLLEKAGLLKRTGTRPKGKRHEALYRPTADRFELDSSGADEDVVKITVKTVASAFRMVERDLAAALVSDQSKIEGPQRNMFVTRMHIRTSPRTLARINKLIFALEELLTSEVVKSQKPSASDQHLSLTLALLPLKGRGQSNSKKGG